MAKQAAVGVKGLPAYGSGPEQMRYNWRPMESFLTSAGYGAGYIVVVLVVAAIAGFIVIRLRAFRREAAGGRG
jgi:hypothetical protein